jgi:hypothetical protein
MARTGRAQFQRSHGPTRPTTTALRQTRREAQLNTIKNMHTKLPTVVQALNEFAFALLGLLSEPDHTTGITGHVTS